MYTSNAEPAFKASDLVKVTCSLTQDGALITLQNLLPPSHPPAGSIFPSASMRESKQVFSVCLVVAVI